MSVQSNTAAESRLDHAERHHSAVARTLGWADDAAARGDYANALGWLQTLEAIGEELADEHQAKRRAWMTLADTGRNLTAADSVVNR